MNIKKVIFLCTRNSGVRDIMIKTTLIIRTTDFVQKNSLKT